MELQDIETNSFLAECASPWTIFDLQNPPIPYIGPAIPDGTILDESEVDVYTEVKIGPDWIRNITNKYSAHYTQLHKYPTRRVATLKAKEPEDLIVGEDMICPVTKKHCDDECCTVGSECNVSGNAISDCEPSNSEEGEQDLWEEILTRLHFDKPFHRTMKDSVIKEFTTKYKITRL